MCGSRTNFLPLILAGTLFLAACPTSVNSCTGLRAQLDTRLRQARLEGHWSADLRDDDLYADSLASALESIRWWRVTRALVVSGLNFVPSEASIVGPDCSGDCRDCIHRLFLVDGDTLSFSEARVPEECSEAPRLSWRSASGSRHTEVLVPLYNWNVDALWCTPHFVIFGLHADYESATARDALVLWNLDSGSWQYAPSGVQYLGPYFTGMSLAALLPSWPRVEIAEDGDAIVVKDRDKSVVLWPARHEWSLLESATGTAISAPRRRVSTPPRLSRTLRDAMQVVMLRVDSKIEWPEIVEVMAPACPTDSSLSAVLVRASTPPDSQGRVDELFGLFLTDHALTKLIDTLEIFPSLRTLDYDALFVPDVAGDSIIVIGLGATYGDQMLVHRFRCEPRSSRRD